MPFKAVFFDIDGTLVDSNDLHVQAWDQAFRDHGHEFDQQRLHDQIGKGTDNFVPALLPDLDEAGQEALGDAHGEIFKGKFLDGVKPFPRARDLIARVHAAGQQVVLASSASKGELDHYLDLLDIRDLVAASTTADDVENTKPAPDIFATALKKVGSLSAAEVVVIGDTPYDIEAAGKCGMAAIALRSGGFAEDALREAGAIAIYDDAAALLDDYDASPLGAEHDAGKQDREEA